MKDNYTVESNVKALWFSRALLDIYLKIWMRHTVVRWQKLIVTLRHGKSKGLGSFCWSSQIYLLDWAYIQQPVKIVFRNIFNHLSWHDFKLCSNCFWVYYFVWKKKAPWIFFQVANLNLQFCGGDELFAILKFHSKY